MLVNELVLREDIQIKPLGSELMIYDMLERKAHVLNSTASEILLLIKEGKSYDDIVKLMVDKHHADIKEAETSVEEIIKEFEANKLFCE